MFIHLREVATQTRHTPISRPVQWLQTHWGPPLGPAGLFPSVLGGCQLRPGGGEGDNPRATCDHDFVVCEPWPGPRVSGACSPWWSSCFLGGKVKGLAPGPSTALPAVVGHPPLVTGMPSAMPPLGGTACPAPSCVGAGEPRVWHRSSEFGVGWLGPQDATAASSVPLASPLCWHKLQHPPRSALFQIMGLPLAVTAGRPSGPRSPHLPPKGPGGTDS